MSLQRLIDVLNEIDAIERDKIDWRPAAHREATNAHEPWAERPDIAPTAAQVKAYAYAELNSTEIVSIRATAFDCYRRVAARLAKLSPILFVLTTWASQTIGMT